MMSSLYFSHVGGLYTFVHMTLAVSLLSIGWMLLDARQAESIPGPLFPFVGVMLMTRATGLVLDLWANYIDQYAYLILALEAGSAGLAFVIAWKMAEDRMKKIKHRGEP